MFFPTSFQLLNLFFLILAVMCLSTSTYKKTKAGVRPTDSRFGCAKKMLKLADVGRAIQFHVLVAVRGKHKHKD